jgi:hypothetical protein
VLRVVSVIVQVTEPPDESTCDVSHLKSPADALPSLVKMLFSYGIDGQVKNLIVIVLLYPFVLVKVPATQSTVPKGIAE